MMGRLILMISERKMGDGTVELVCGGYAGQIEGTILSANRWPCDLHLRRWVSEQSTRGVVDSVRACMDGRLYGFDAAYTLVYTE